MLGDIAKAMKEMFSLLLQTNRNVDEDVQRAIKSTYMAAMETKIYLHKLESLDGERDDLREQAISKLWQEAAVDCMKFDTHLSQVAHAKALYWAVGDYQTGKNWFTHDYWNNKDTQLDISLNEVFKKLEEIGSLPKYTQRPKI